MFHKQFIIFTIFCSLHVFRIGWLPLYGLEEWHKEELIFCEFSQVGYSVACGTSIQHCHHVILL